MSFFKEYESATIRHINKIIEVAILHGGDLGGPYGCEREKLLSVMNSFKKWAGLSDWVIIETDIGFAYAKLAHDSEEEE